MVTIRQAAIAAWISLLPFGVYCQNGGGSTGPETPGTIVELIGPLRTDGNRIIGADDEPAVLRGMSLFWSQWEGEFYNRDCLQWLRDDWKCTVIRAAMGIEYDGYLTNKAAELTKIRSVIDACIDLGIYVIIDWHSHHGEEQLTEARAFFALMAQLYGEYPNVIYEIFNEPLDLDWSSVLKPWSEAVIAEIRAHDPDNLIIVGTSTWSQDVDDASLDPLDDANTAYALHFYAGTHGQQLRSKAAAALNRGAALFVSEWGVSKADATGGVHYEETGVWLEFMDTAGLSWCNWSVADKDETTSIVKPGTSPLGNWQENDLTESGRYLRAILVEANTPLFEQLGE
ncbi:glycoside hydrolase family 5 protein [bacterium]|nr:glycoside hydrolase family 5 protein [bacterium]